MTVNGELCGLNRFDPVLTALKKTNNPMLQLACLQFINAVVNTPDDVDFKIHLRNEFMRGGLGDLLAVSLSAQGMKRRYVCAFVHLKKAARPNVYNLGCGSGQ